MIWQAFLFGWTAHFLLARFLRSDAGSLSAEFGLGTERNQSLIVFSIQIVVPDQMRTLLLRTLGSVLGPTRVAPGCLSARLFADLDERKTLMLVEEWVSRDQFERNLDNEKVNAIVAAIELSSEAPVVRVDTVEREEGVDTLALHRSVARGGAVR
jgi:quinol monooxygenase YgiN